jgi:hypothetical protein
MTYNPESAPTDNRLSSPSKILPMLVMRASPQEVNLSRIYFRDLDGTALSVRWNGSSGTTDDFGWSTGGDFNSMLPTEFGYYIWNASLNRFSLLSSDGWSKAAFKLIEMRKADLFQEDIAQAINDGVDAGLKKNKAKPKRGSNLEGGATADVLEEMRLSNRF